MTAAPIHFHDERLMLDPAGAAYWPGKRISIVSDLHLEKASAAATRGSLLPPYDTRATLEKLQRLIRHYRPEKIVALGDSFHDMRGVERMSATDRAKLNAMAQQTHFIWIAGNHDAAPSSLAGESMEEWQEGPFVFRHQAVLRMARGGTEISGGGRLMLPAFGAYTGGLNVRDPVITRLFPRGLRVFLLGDQRLFSFALGQLE